MSSEPVSDKRLEKELAVVKGGIDTNAERGEEAFVAFSGERVTDLYAMLLELKSRRAQQAEPPAGCAEMATTIEKAIADADESGFDEGRCAIIAAKLAPWCALLAECRESIGEYRGLCECELDPECKHCRMTYTLLTKLDAALGKGDADGGREEGK